MEWTLAIPLGLMAAAALAWLAGRGGGTSAYPRGVRRVLFSRAERSLLAALERATSRDERVFGKVSLRDAFALDPRLHGRFPAPTAGQPEARALDFLVVRAEDLRVTCVIDIESPGRSPLDEASRRALDGAGVRHLRLAHKDAYARADVREVVRVRKRTRMLVEGTSTQGA